MEIVACGKGHFYDKSKGECPQCAAERKAAECGNQVMDYDRTMPVLGEANGGFYDGNRDGVPPTIPVSPQNSGQISFGKTEPVSKDGFSTEEFNASRRGVLFSEQDDDYPETRPVGFNDVSNFDPIVGWLVCINGPGRGQDYRIHAGNNRIGRNPSNDIYLQGDNTVSKNDNCTIAYDNRGGHFFFAAGTGKNMVYVNDEVVFNYVELHAYDVILVGSTKLMFVPFCGEHFSWNQ